MFNRRLAVVRERVTVIAEPAPKSSVTVADGLAVFAGAKVEIRGGCEHCSGDHIPAWRRGGKLVEAIYPDGRKNWICHYCGRAADLVSKQGLYESANTQL